jgi:hypothetical protein
MRYFIFIIASLVSLLSADIKFVVSPACNIKSISSREVKQLFLLKKTFIGSQNIKVIDNVNEKIYTDFTRIYIGKSTQKMKIYWARMLFTGRKVPPKKLSFNELKKIKNNTQCYVSYIEQKEKIKLWQVLAVK